ncbi:hypothetical protein Glove_219g78 [Diversispora epigaea]|uniref:Uncharacterized protein n=1 Tax=Diversispora epigaea TaxID=1348612 RepID=A0A397IIY0_9GLOM|nr:hypothetical protein Glove_219g78 [Diversispora epigaea]
METSTFDEENNDTLYIAELARNNYENYEENELENDENNDIQEELLQNTIVRGTNRGRGQGRSRGREMYLIPNRLQVLLLNYNGNETILIKFSDTISSLRRKPLTGHIMNKKMSFTTPNSCKRKERQAKFC